MDHSKALEMLMVEKYILGELSPSEGEEFEQHFFDCAECSEDLRIMAVLQDHAKDIFGERNLPVAAPQTIPAPSAAGWRIFGKPWGLIPAFAGLLVCVLAGYQTFIEVPHLQGQLTQVEAPQQVSEFPLYAAARGDETVVRPDGSRFFTLYVDKTWQGDYTSYRSVMRSASGGADLFSILEAAPAPGKAMDILVSASSFSQGKYVLVVFGVDGQGKETEVSRFPFRLEFD